MSSRDCNSCSNLLKRDGTSQKQRLFEEQQPDYVKVDERSYIDLVQFTLSYAGKIQFWDVFNRRSGDWISFMENSQASVYTEIANTNFKALQAAFDVYFSGDFSTATPAKDNTAGMVVEIFNQALLLDNWLGELDEDVSLDTELKNIIQRQAAPLVQTLIEYDLGAESMLGTYTSPVDYSLLSDFWAIDATNAIANTNIFGSATNISDKAINAKRYFGVLFGSLLDVLDKVKSDAEEMFVELLEEYSLHEPYFALFLAFIQLFRQAQDHINEFTEKHLDFYYRDVLRLEEKEATPDSVHIILEPAKNVDQKRVEAGTSLKAGKDAEGNEITFQTDKEIVINKAKVAELKSLYLDRGRDTKYIQTIYSAIQANSEDGKGEEFIDVDAAWEPFGKTQVKDGVYIGERSMDLARVGFSIASPEFRLAEGQRTVRLSLVLNQTEFNNVFGASGSLSEFMSVNPQETSDGVAIPNNTGGYETLLSEWLSFQFSGEEGWFTPDNFNSDAIANITIGDFVGAATSTIIIELTLSREQQAIVAYDAELHSGSYDSQWPILEILFNQTPTTYNQRHSFAYEFLKDLRIDRAVIETEASGVTKLKVGNDTGPLDSAKPFKPFTSNPQVGSNFYIGSAEIFSKRLTQLSVNLDWKGVPSDDLAKHYKHFFEDINPNGIAQIEQIVQNNEHFTAQIKFLEDHGWKDLSYDEGDPRELHQSSGVALRQKREVMVSPLSFLLMAFIGGIEQYAQTNQEMAALPVQRDLTTRNFVHLFRTGEIVDGILPDGTIDTANDNDARLPRKIVVESTESGVPYGSLASEKSNFDLLTVDENTDQRYKRDTSLVELKDYSEGAKRGYIKLELINDFFHGAYGKVLTERALESANTTTTTTTTTTSGTTTTTTPTSPEEIGIPNTPYIPELHKISLDYKSTFELDYSTAIENPITWESRVEQFYHITPFGEVEVLPTNSEKAVEDEGTGVYYSDRILPKLYKDANEITADGRPETKIDLATGRSVDIVLEETAEGSLIIGVSDFTTPQSLSLLFQFKEGTEDNDLEVADIQWSYLSDNQWEAFDKSDIASDGTNGFVNSGIVQFSVSQRATNNNTLLGAGLHWFRAQIAGNTEAFSDLISVHAQAVTASFVDADNDPYRLNTPIESDTISKFVNKDFEIKTMTQPYESFGGRIKEQSSEYYTRVAERLRHKQRGITIRDYEHLVLEEFPAIYKVKCINHTSRYSEYAPGNVSVVVIPYFKNKNEKNPFELKVSKAKLSEIRRFLVKLNSPFVNLDVRNPKYEPIRVHFGVEFHIGYDRTFYENQLNEEIKEFISPWAFGKEEDIIFGGKINHSIILNFIEERPYVDFVTGFRMYQQENENKAEVEVLVAEGTTASSVLVTALDHIIEEAQCDLVEVSGGDGGSFDDDSFDGGFD